MPRIQKRSDWATKMRNFLYSTPIEILVYLFIILSVSFLAIEVASAELYHKYQIIFEQAENFFIIFFTLEYVLKFISAQDKWVYFRSSIIDLLAILPFLRFFRLLRGIKILRLLRLVRLLRLGSLIARKISQMDGARNFREIIIIAVVFSSTVLGGSIGILLFERTANGEMFQDLGDGLWWCIVTVTTVGYGDKYPITLEGKILGVVLMLVGLSFYGLVAGLGSNFIINRLKKGGEWMVATFTDHAVILGVNDKLDRIVDLLLKHKKRVVIIADDIDRVRQYPENKVIIIEGDFVDERILKKARLEHADTAIILGDTHGRSAKDADARSVLATLAVERIKPEIRTVVEALDNSTAFHLHNANVDEIISSGALTAEMLAFSTDHPGYSKNLSVLLHFAYRNRIARVPVPRRLEGKSISDVISILAQERKILLGIMRGGKETLDPDHVLDTAKDELVYIEII